MLFYMKEIIFPEQHQAWFDFTVSLLLTHFEGFRSVSPCLVHQLLKHPLITMLHFSAAWLSGRGNVCLQCTVTCYPVVHEVPVFRKRSPFVTNWPAGVSSPGTAAVTGCGPAWPGAAAAAAGSWSPLDSWAVTEGHKHTYSHVRALMPLSLSGRTQETQTCSLRYWADACKLFK